MWRRILAARERSIGDLQEVSAGLGFPARLGVFLDCVSYVCRTKSNETNRQQAMACSARSPEVPGETRNSQLLRRTRGTCCKTMAPVLTAFKNFRTIVRCLHPKYLYGVSLPFFASSTWTSARRRLQNLDGASLCTRTTTRRKAPALAR